MKEQDFINSFDALNKNITKNTETAQGQDNIKNIEELENSESVIQHGIGLVLENKIKSSCEFENTRNIIQHTGQVINKDIIEKTDEVEFKNIIESVDIDKNNDEVENMETDNNKPRNILDLCEIKYDPKESFSEFYNNFRTLLSDYLMKKGDQVGPMELLQDEILTPTFEEIIIFWCLEKVDPSLPMKIKEELGTINQKGATLKTMEHKIFKLAGMICERDLNDKPTRISNEKERNGHKSEFDNSTSPYKVKHENVEAILVQNFEVGNNQIKLEEEDLVPILNDDFNDQEEFDQDNSNSDEDLLGSDNDVDQSFIKTESNNANKNPFQCTDCDKTFNTRKKRSDHIRRKHNVIRTCKICNATFPDFATLKMHRREEHLKISKSFSDTIEECGKSIFKSCTECDITFESIEEMKAHKKENHRNEKSGLQEVCQECGKSIHQSSIKRHMEKMHGTVNRFACKHCDESFNSVEERSRHRRKTHPRSSKGSDPCPQCGKMIHKSSLKRHIALHTKVKVRTCKLCDETFKTQKELLNHRKKEHKKNKGVEMCPECGKLIHKSSLKRHRLIHISDIRCTICSERFISQDALDEHLKRHEEDPTYCRKRSRTIQCDICKRSFVDVEDFGAHVCKHFSCDMCDMKFIIERNLKMHKRAHEGENLYSCDLCESLFLNKKALRLHKRCTHDPDQRKHKCDECGKNFLNKSQLDRHMGSHSTERPYKCDTCYKGFKQRSALDIHKITHTGEKPFPCVDCDMRFRSLTEMKKHRETNGKCTGIKDIQEFPKSES